MKRKAPVAIFTWAAVFVASVVLAPFNPIFGGIVIGSVVTAALLLLAVKWSIEDLVSNQMDSINQMEAALDKNLGDEFPDMDEPHED